MSVINPIKDEIMAGSVTCRAIKAYCAPTASPRLVLIIIHRHLNSTGDQEDTRRVTNSTTTRAVFGVSLVAFATAAGVAAEV